ncbi:MAG: hypothetical protein MUP33_08695, partial [Polaromonas sp.]|nr:hypothetical protein [Polaromonas sp.]
MEHTIKLSSLLLKAEKHGKCGFQRSGQFAIPSKRNRQSSPLASRLLAADIRGYGCHGVQPIAALCKLQRSQALLVFQLWVGTFLQQQPDSLW